MQKVRIVDAITRITNTSTESGMDSIFTNTPRKQGRLVMVCKITNFLKNEISTMTRNKIIFSERDSFASMEYRSAATGLNNNYFPSLIEELTHQSRFGNQREPFDTDVSSLRTSNERFYSMAIFLENDSWKGIDVFYTHN